MVPCRYSVTGPLGYQLLRFGCSRVKLLKSVDSLKHVVSKNVHKQIAEGWVARPFDSPPFGSFHLSPLGIMAKQRPNTCRIIYHSSFSKGESLNDEISVELASVSYVTFEKALSKIRPLGKNSLLAKADIKSALDSC